MSHLSDSFSVHGTGQVACSEYLSKAENESFALSIRVWLQGFFTAVNATGAAVSFEINESDLNDSIEFINKHCSSAENKELWVAQLANIYWRTKFKEFQKHAN